MGRKINKMMWALSLNQYTTKNLIGKVFLYKNEIHNQCPFVIDQFDGIKNCQYT